jgi:hypothetical protein
MENGMVLLETADDDTHKFVLVYCERGCSCYRYVMLLVRVDVDMIILHYGFRNDILIR